MRLVTERTRHVPANAVGLGRLHPGNRPLTALLDGLRLALKDRYTVERELGAGGMATVYLATDLRHEREVAVKVLRPDLSASVGSERFLQEIRIAARLNHPHILPLLDSGAAGAQGEILYYVMPYVRGESLRERLAREGELPVPDAVRIMRDVADALAHAHEHGVVHRDIKPENILLSGRHALVADFGVAKALSDATGRSQVTTAGVALGTPAYMSPEQAVADPHIDHRADIYALGVVGYEMLAGEPPFTGGSPQQVLAAHVTAAPSPVSARRPVVPPPLADAVMRCLAKSAADRWQSASALVAELEAVQTPTGGSTPTETRPYAAVTRRRSSTALIAGLALVAIGAAAAGAWQAGLLASGDAERAVALRDRVQITSTGEGFVPAISPDGTQFAYVTRECVEGRCSYAVHMQDVGGAASRQVLAGAGGVYHIEWSSDRRHLLVTATLDGRWGTHIVPVLGGAPRLLSTAGVAGGAAGVFLASDTLVTANLVRRDSVQWLHVTTLPGVTVDSIRLETGGRQMTGIAAVPGGRWLIVHLDGPDGETRLVDRSGRVADRRALSAGVIRASGDAVWFSPFDFNDVRSIVRITLDTAAGRLGRHDDTVYAGRFTSYDVTADGGTLVLDDGSTQVSAWAVPISDLLAGRFPDSALLFRGSVEMYAQISPDGGRVLIGRPAAASGSGRAYSWQPFPGGPENRIRSSGPLLRAFWEDTVTVAAQSATPGGVRLALIDIRTGAERNVMTVPERIIRDYEPLPGGGWVWLPASGTEMVVRRGDSLASVAVPAWYESAIAMSQSPAGRLAITGWNAATGDTTGVMEIDLATGSATPWFAGSMEAGDIRMHHDGTILLTKWESQETASLIHLTGPGRTRTLGTVPRSINSVSVSDDLTRATVEVRERFGDVWMMRVTGR